MTKLIDLIMDNAAIEEIELDLANNSHIYDYINQQDLCSYTALHYACGKKNLEIAKLLLAHPKIDVTKTHRWGHTALHFAVLSDSLQAVKLLLEDKRINIDQVDDHGYTALYIAQQKGFTEIIKLLEEASNYLMFNGKKYKLVEEIT